MSRVVLLGALCAVFISVSLVNQVEAQSPRGTSRSRSESARGRILGAIAQSNAAKIAEAKRAAAVFAAAAKKAAADAAAKKAAADAAAADAAKKAAAAAAKKARYYHPPPAPAPVPSAPPFRPPIIPINPVVPQTPNNDCPNNVPISSCSTQCAPGRVCRAYPGAQCIPDPCSFCAPSYYLFGVPICCDRCPTGFPAHNIGFVCDATGITCNAGQYCRPNYCRPPGSTDLPYDCIDNCPGGTKEPECPYHPCQFVTCPAGFHCEHVNRCSCNGVCLVGPPQTPPSPPPYH